MNCVCIAADGLNDVNIIIQNNEEHLIDQLLSAIYTKYFTKLNLKELCTTSIWFKKEIHFSGKVEKINHSELDKEPMTGLSIICLHDIYFKTIIIFNHKYL